MADARGYRPIEDYAAIGDCHGGALVARDGEVDWCCLARFDADPLFYRLLDQNRGGFLSVRVAGGVTSARHYLDGSNVLRTEFTCAGGRVAFTDFMPVGRSEKASLHDYVNLIAPGWLVRSIEVLSGEVELNILIHQPGLFSSATAAPPVEIGSDFALAQSDRKVTSRAQLRAGDKRFIAIGPGAAGTNGERIEHFLQVTLSYWREWLGYCRYQGPFRGAVRRSALALKLLCYAPAGTVAAAMTTSLPETLGGERNWDYRACWIRDASLMLLALATLGYSGESKQFYDVLAQAAMQGPERLQIGYGLALERELPERNLTHLDGYRGSRPVRIGNAAFTQHQADLYGYVLDAVLAYRELGGSIAPEHRPHFAALVDHVAVIADQPDLGIWEVRAEPQHFVHSKAACWAALDRGIRLFGARAPWLEQRDRVLESLRREGCGPRGYTRAYASADTDAALLLLPALGLPMSRAQLDLTLDRIQHELLSGEYVYRYRAEDGMAGKEGAFLACSFWLVDALLSADRGAQAHALFSRLIARANDVGLYSEEADPASGVMLGNFPQALTHLALVSSATSLALYDEHGVEALAGAYADHARRSVGATIGWRGVMAALFRAGMWPKLFASQHSRLSI